jgi:hypothetical protein
VKKKVIVKEKERKGRIKTVTIIIFLMNFESNKCKNRLREFGGVFTQNCKFVVFQYFRPCVVPEGHQLKKKKKKKKKKRFKKKKKFIKIYGTQGTIKN